MYGKDLIPNNLLKQKQDSDSKRYLDKTDYATIKIAEETAKVVLEIAKLVGLNYESYSALEGVYLKYKQVLEERKEKRESIDNDVKSWYNASGELVRYNSPHSYLFLKLW